MSTPFKISGKISWDLGHLLWLVRLGKFPLLIIVLHGDVLKAPMVVDSLLLLLLIKIMKTYILLLTSSSWGWIIIHILIDIVWVKSEITRRSLIGGVIKQWKRWNLELIKVYIRIVLAVSSLDVLPSIISCGEYFDIEELRIG